MKLATAVITTIEMSADEQDAMWNTPCASREVCGQKVLIWDTGDGNNLMLLEGGTVFRQVIITN